MDRSVRLNLGCSIHKLEGYINIDIDPTVSPELVHDITKKMPFDDNSVSEIIASQIFEHIPNFVDVIIELHRIMKPDALLKIAFPEFPCRAALIDPTHVKYLMMETFFMFCHPDNFLSSNFRGRGLFDVVETFRIKWDCPEYPMQKVPGDYFTEVRIVLKKVDKDYWKVPRKKDFEWQETTRKR